ncbi:MAG: Ivy family c-type lysozyme inhibitor [Burkholderiaceae bacterium]
MNRLIFSAILALGATDTPAWAQGKLDADTMKSYGGTYQVDCSNNASPKATVFPDALVFLNGDKRIAGSKPEAQASYHGNSPPPEYRVMLASEAPGGQLLFEISQDKAGYYLKLYGEPKVQAAIGKPLSGQKFRRCDGTAKPMQTAAAAPVAAQATATSQGQGSGNSAKIFKGYALTELSASGLLYNTQAKATYHKALGPLTKEPWLAKLDGPSSEFRPVKVAGADYMLGYTCKNRDCYENTVVLLWSGVQNVVYGKVVQSGKSTLIGAPPPAVAAELEKLWKTTFRSQPK